MVEVESDGESENVDCEGGVRADSVEDVNTVFIRPEIVMI